MLQEPKHHHFELIRVIDELTIENAKMKRNNENLEVENERLRAKVAVLRDALIRMRDSTHTSAAVLRGMADFELQKAALGGEKKDEA